MRCWLQAAMLAALMAAGAPAAAQDAPQVIPRVEEAESVFRQALQAFEQEDYGMAYRRFRLVVDSYPLNRKTTAAYLMAAKSLYRDGEYQRAEALLNEFLQSYPTSSYRAEAETLLGYARMQVGLDDERDDVVSLGIALPLRDQDASRSQALFNGIRLAVDEHNDAGVGPRVRMVFRDTEGEAGKATVAVNELVEEEVRAIVGPLYSDEAKAAGEAAERAGVVLVAPLATEEAVSQGRRYVFQANPTISLRGRLMAQFAVRSLRLDRFGVVTELNNSISERMAEGFQEEALRQGAEVPFFILLPDARGWGRLADELGPDTLRDIQALYLPIAGNNATARVADALAGLDAMLPTPAAKAQVRLLGNAEWHDVPQKVPASQYLATYTNDFYVDRARPEVQEFIARYQALGEGEPDRLAYAGYDVTRFVLARLASQSDDRPLDEALREAPLYEGLGTRLDFREGNVNHAMFYHRYRNGQLELLR